MDETIWYKFLTERDKALHGEPLAREVVEAVSVGCDSIAMECRPRQVLQDFSETHVEPTAAQSL